MKTVTDFYRTYPDLEEKVEKAYEIHGRLYEGQSITEQDQIEYETIIRELLDHSEPSGKQDLPFTLCIWLMYAIKYL